MSMHHELKRYVTIIGYRINKYYIIKMVINKTITRKVTNKKAVSDFIVKKLLHDSYNTIYHK